MSSLDVRAIDEKDLRKEQAPAVRHEYRVFLSEEAFDRAVARGESDTTREIGGVLVGELLRDDQGPYLRIEETIDALHAEEKGAELTFTHATWEHIHKEMDSRGKGKRVVGWYHTHPGFGVFLSDRDQFIHKSFFNLPFQVAFVYDPKAKEHGMFTWRDGEIQRTRRYWVGPREQAWDGPRTAAKPADKDKDKGGADARGKPERAAEEVRDEGGPSAMALFVGIAVVLVLIAAFVGHWFGAGSANRAIVNAQIEVAKAKEEGRRVAIESLHHELVGILRATLGDEVMHKPARAVIADLDKAIAGLQALLPAAPAAGAGSAAAPATPAAPAAGAGSAPAAAPAPAPAATSRIEQAIVLLQAARASLVRLLEDRGTAEAVLAQLERAGRHGAAVRADLVRDVATQRSGLGRLYAELAADAAKAGDAARARQLLTAAALLDPGNRPRYEKQLQTFDKSGTLPQKTEDGAGSAGSGDQR